MGEKAVLVILDGVGDLPVNGRTPLSSARKPNIDRLAAEGITGLMHTIGRGVVPGSDTAHLALFGYEPQQYYRGRGTFEALGVGIKLVRGDVAFRANFATAGAGGAKILDRRAGRIGTPLGRELGKALDGITIDGVKILFKPSVEHRATLVLRGSGLSSRITDTDPHSLGKVLKSRALSKEGKKTADILNKFTKMSYDTLSKSPLNKNRKPPANIVLARGAGVFEKVEPVSKRFGIKAACVAGGALYKGVASYVGMDILNAEGATGTKDTNLLSKARKTVAALRTNDLAVLHIKATDSFSHDGNFEGKRQFIEKIDRQVIPLLARTGAFIVLTGDHTTACSLRNHSSEPVPILIWGKRGRIRADPVKKFDEFSCAGGGLGHIRGKDVMPFILSLLGKARIYGS